MITEIDSTEIVMPEQSSMHYYLNWAKERIDEMDAALASLEVRANQAKADSKVQGDQLIINPALSKVWVTKDIELHGNAGSIVGATIIHQSFHQISVPDGGSTVFLLGVALSGLGLIRGKLR